MKVLIAGDFCPRDRVAVAFEKEDYASVLDEVHNITSEADYSIVNFECPVVTGNAKPVKKLGGNLRCTTHGAKALKYARFDCVTLANNHFLDYGEEGVKETISTLDALNIDHVGGGVNLAEASKVFYKVIAGQCLAIVNCCENEFSIATVTTAGSNPLNPVKQYYAIKEASKKADHVLVIVHGGHEHYQFPSSRMVETYRFFIDAGADTVVNHHQHCFSGFEIYHGRPIFYGLGNFCFDKLTKHDGIWTEGYAVLIDFSMTEPAFTIFPYCQCAEKPKIELLPLSAYKDKLDALNAIIADPIALQSNLDKYYASCADQYSNIIEPIRNRFYLTAKRRGWMPSFIDKKRKLTAANFIICEAHRDKLIWWLKNK